MRSLNFWEKEVERVISLKTRPKIPKVEKNLAEQGLMDVLSPIPKYPKIGKSVPKVRGSDGCVAFGRTFGTFGTFWDGEGKGQISATEADLREFWDFGTGFLRNQKKQNDRETFGIDSGLPQKYSIRDPGVPKNAVITFPSMRRDPDLMGFGVPSETLPDILKIFGYWGYGLRVCKPWRYEWVELESLPQSDPNDRHVSHWIKENHGRVLEAFKKWRAQQSAQADC